MEIIILYKHVFIYFLCYVTFNSQGHIAAGNLRVEEPVHTSWSRFCTLNNWASASNYQLSNINRPGWDLSQRPQRLKASTLTATPPSPLYKHVAQVLYCSFSWLIYFLSLERVFLRVSTHLVSLKWWRNLKLKLYYIILLSPIWPWLLKRM